jgi:hypothetical protein
LPLKRFYRKIERSLTLNRELKRLKPSAKVAVATTLAILVLVSLAILEAMSIFYLRQFNQQIFTAMTAALTWIAATYWARKT